MKKKIILLTALVFLMGTIFTGCGQSKSGTDNSWNEIKQKGQFVVGLDDSFPPMGFRNDSGQIIGFDIDMAKEAAKRMGVKVVFKPVQWDGIILSLKNKDIDLIWNGLTITDKRKQQIDFSNVYLQNKQIIVTTKDSPIKSKKDLASKVVGLQLGSSSETALNSDTSTKNSLKEIKKYSNNTEALLDLKNGRVSAVIVDEVVGRYYIAKKPGVYKVLNDNFGKEDYGIGIRKTDTSFKNKLNETLNSMKKDGTEDKISKKWFGEDIIPH
ncbi:transporter substrate-binding domain-containing protein [Clostridium tyrobutyricum]|uniref:Amino acid ABC transporter, amino acid-binding protein n=1 Tax=Clostridium tyrobutyricum DIVETGP TaxID=1408889 RepID=W6N2M6_CLOTY|nr:amino acid ABC transporter substrate-binding protein [Clostridium tyrobutyricum]AND84096.1 amino acid ABC transporter substrate-binding protein [Clostridium tyrobutyricum]ANP68825.1 amino acid ABC transporter substrate-binding protein [Clostridium tyrobutyricum]MBR9647237.1 amino acid ABC transporter substrate-binding protein [Clostridium tyrobutyricum]MBV4417351.1 amino acid ABC transporter substrate-binding protein [Clostridium tyrobutyricum]MBV4422896.1 amino acid ABC transporter substra